MLFTKYLLRKNESFFVDCLDLLKGYIFADLENDHIEKKN